MCNCMNRHKVASLIQVRLLGFGDAKREAKVTELASTYLKVGHRTPLILGMQRHLQLLHGFGMSWIVGFKSNVNPPAAECGSSTPKVDVQSFCHFCPASPGYDTEDCMARSLNSGMDTSSHQVCHVVV